MALDFDEFPVNDPIAQKDSGALTGVWRDSLATFWQTLVSYVTSGGIAPPQLTSAQRDTLKNLANGQMIYNITVDAPQFYQVSSASWRTVTFT